MFSPTTKLQKEFDLINKTIINICSIMEINQIRHFCALVEVGHLRKTAELLKMSPGALSKSISNLRGEFQSDLMIQDGKRHILTDQGKLFYNDLKKVLIAFDQIHERARSTSKIVEPEARIGTFEVFSTYFLSEAIGALREYRIECLEVSPGQIEQALLNNEIDLGITYLPVPHPKLIIDKICNIRFSVFGISKWTHNSPEQLPFSVPTSRIPQNPNSAYGLDMWPLKFSRHIKFRFQMLQTSLLTASKGESVVFCPTFVTRAYNLTVKPEFKLNEIINIQIPTQKHGVYLVRRGNDSESRQNKKLAKMLRLLCTEN